MSIFGTDGIRSRVNEYPMTPEIAMKVAAILGNKSLNNNNGSLNRVIVGKDTRKSCYMIESAIIAGLTASGANVILTGPIPTPAVSMLTNSLRACYGIMISASHNSFEDNGIKIFDNNGIKLSNEDQIEIEKLLQLSNAKFYTESKFVGRVKRLDDVVGRYIEFVKSSVSHNLSFNNFKIVLDLANGAAYKIAPQIFEELGATVHVINNDPNGENINHKCGSTSPHLVSKTVQKLGFDIGIAVDGDADRLIICDEKGDVIDGDHIIAAIVKFMLDEKKLKNSGVAITIMSNKGLEDFLKSLGLNVERTKVGDRNVTSTMQKMQFNVGGEQSGHIILSDYSYTGDGILSAIQVVSYLIKNNFKASSILNLFSKVPQTSINLKIDENKKINLHSKESLAFLEKIENELNPGRVIVRKSGTENLIRIMVESRDARVNEFYLDKIIKYFESI